MMLDIYICDTLEVYQKYHKSIPKNSKKFVVVFTFTPSRTEDEATRGLLTGRSFSQKAKFDEIFGF